ncbi:MAG: ankyrin repeat domain-containing protein [Bacteroidota bacterium]
MRKFFRSAKPDPQAQLARLMELIEQEDREQAKKILKAHPDILNLRNDYGMFPLLYAVSRQSAEMVDMLLESGAEVNQTNRDDSHALAIVVLENNLGLAERLLKAGANPDRPDRYQATLLFYCAQNNLAQMAELLLRFGANPSKRENEGDTPLIYAVMANALETAKVLLDKGADKYARNFDGLNALDKAHHTEMQQLLA